MFLNFISFLFYMYALFRHGKYHNRKQLKLLYKLQDKAVFECRA